MTVYDYYQLCGIYKKWHKVTFVNFTNDAKAKAKVQRYLNNHAEAYEDGVGLFLYGDNGVGKTMLMNIAFKDLIDKRYKVRVISLSDLISLFTGAWYSEEESSELQLIKKVQFLGIEEVGKEFRSTMREKDAKNTDIIVTVLDNILRFRLQNNLPTWFTSNLSPKQIDEKYSHDIFSMLKEHCVPIKISGEDYRDYVRIDKVIK